MTDWWKKFWLIFFLVVCAAGLGVGLYFIISDATSKSSTFTGTFSPFPIGSGTVTTPPSTSDANSTK